jgi:predicted metal-dependent peptidase
MRSPYESINRSTPIDYPALNKLLDKAKVALMVNANSTFFTTILFSMKFMWDESCQTAWTTGLRLGFSPHFFLWLTPEERVFVLVHECCHPAYMHIDPFRKGTRDHRMWNAAADHVINLMLKAQGFTMPPIGLADDRFIGLATEQVYKTLMDEQDQGLPPPALGDMEDIRDPGDEAGADGNQMSKADVKRALDDILIRAQVESRMQGDSPGSIPGEIELYLDKLLNPKLPWQQILRKWLKELGKYDYSFKKPNRRFFPQYYLPSLWSEGAMVDFQAWVDISGSETDADFLRFISELHGILKMMMPKKIELGQFDTCIQSITTVKNVMDLANVEFHGRGGTNITDVLDHIEKTKPKVAMVFSDGGFRHDRAEVKGVNVLWMIHDNPGWTAPFGKVVHYNTFDKE